MLRNLSIGVVAIFLPALAVADAPPQRGSGKIDWANRVIIAKGSGAPNLKAPNVAVARLQAERAAKLDALRNILETLKGVRIQGKVTVKDKMTDNQDLTSKVEGICRGFETVKIQYYSDGGVDVTVKMSLDGELAEALLPAGKGGEGVKSGGDKKHTGLIIDVTGMGYQPLLVPSVTDEAGAALYGLDFVTSEAIQKRGFAAFIDTLEEAKQSPRVGATPLVVRAAKISEKGEIILGEKDAELLRDSNADLSYLKAGQVVIVVGTDSPSSR
ncbi:MAG: LPP20 family lipoprotein [Deltaproteobacteria bacterium]|nr:LPP20 family lipoprotein [Deltaproteobacteria bacterium]